MELLRCERTQISIKQQEHGGQAKQLGQVRQVLRGLEQQEHEQVRATRTRTIWASTASPPRTVATYLADNYDEIGWQLRAAGRWWWRQRWLGHLRGGRSRAKLVVEGWEVDD